MSRLVWILLGILFVGSATATTVGLIGANQLLKYDRHLNIQTASDEVIKSYNRDDRQVLAVTGTGIAVMTAVSLIVIWRLVN